jgi:hypothetical protein
VENRVTYEVRLFVVPLKHISNRPCVPSHEREPYLEVRCVCPSHTDSTR